MRRRHKLFSGGIFRRQFVTLFGTTIFFFGVTCLALLLVTGKAIINRQIEVSAAYRDEIRLRIVDWLEERRDDIQYLARVIDSEGPEGRSTAQAAKKILLFCSTDPIFRDVALVASDGIVVADKQGPTDRRTNVADRAYFRDALQGVNSVSGLIRGRLNNDAEIAVTAALRPNSAGGSMGAESVLVVGFLPLDALSAIVDDVSLRDLGSAYLIDEAGRIVSAAGFSKRYKELGPEAAGASIDNYATRELRAGRQGTGQYEGYGGSAVVGAFTRVEPLGLGLAVELSRDRALKPVTAILESGLIFLIPFLVLLAFVSVIFSARLIAPIQALAAAAEGVIRDKDHEPIDIRTGTELDQLVELFNKMAAAIREREEILKDSAARDSLTGLYNHARIEEFLDLEIRRKRRSSEKVAFVMLDIDFFKLVNDEFGHLAGDEVLRGIARILEASVRGGDIAGRYGGEEFSVILDARSDDEVATFCDRIGKSVEKSVFLSGGNQMRVTVSIGWTRMDADSQGSYEFVRSADRSLYHAKETGRNKVVGYSDAKGS
jgi:diguanylate cyclase (GGDEF)-like protein